MKTLYSYSAISHCYPRLIHLHSLIRNKFTNAVKSPFVLYSQNKLIPKPSALKIQMNQQH